ncbi:hypothetical protein ABFU82_12355 [Nocardioides sp. WV_118_6]
MSATSARAQALIASFKQAGIPEELVIAMLKDYEENKRRYFLDDLRPAGLNGGRFCEAVTRILQFLATGTYVALSDELKVDRVLNQLENATQLEDGLRLHVTRAMRLIYGVRNKRDIGHLKGGIDPSLQDATLVVGCLDWILAELVRVAHGVSADDAQAMMADIVTRDVPLIEEIDGQPILLDDIPRGDHVLALLYWDGTGGTPKPSLRAWLPDRIKKHLTDVLRRLETDHLVHLAGERVHLTRRGIAYVQDNDLLRPL